MKKILFVFTFIATTVAEAENLPATPAVAALGSIQSIVLLLGSWTLAGALLGCILAKIFGKKSKHLKETLFSIAASTGLGIGVANQLGIFPF